MATAAATTFPAQPVPAAPGVERIDPLRLLAFLAMCFGMFMAFLDIQVVSASLSEIQAGLAASSDEITWVQTSYLMAEVVAIPLSGFLSRALGTRIMFAGAAAGFTVASLMCGLTIDNEPNDRLARAAGLHRRRHGADGVCFRLRDLSALAPVGDHADDWPRCHARADHRPDCRRLSHRRPLLALAVLHQHRAGHRRHHRRNGLDRLRSAGFCIVRAVRLVGLIFMALFLGALEYVLEDGPRYDWFEDSAIAFAAVVSASSAVIFFARVLMARQPIVDLRAFLDRNFALGSMFSFVLGIGLYGLTYLYPIYLGEIRGYNALMVGQTMFVSGAAMFLSAPIVGRLMTRTDARLMLAAGFTIVALSNWQMSYLTKDWDFWQLFVPQILRGFGMMLAIVPITNISLVTLAPDLLKNGSGLFNLTRNLGGAVGLAGLNTVLDKRIDLHLARLHEFYHLGATAGGRSAEQSRRSHSRLGCAKHGTQATLSLYPPTGNRDGICRRLPAALPALCCVCSAGLAHAAPSAGCRRNGRALERVMMHRGPSHSAAASAGARPGPFRSAW